MKTTLFTSCALATLAFCSVASANDVFVGGSVEFNFRQGDQIETNESMTAANPTGSNTSFTDYRDDYVGDFDAAFATSADVTFKAGTKTRMLDYSAYVNLDLEETGTGFGLSDVDAHIRVRMAHGTFKFGTDIDGLQGAEDLDWVVVGPEDFTASITKGMTNAGTATTTVNDHLFTQGVTKSSLKTTAVGFPEALNDSSITFTTNTVNGFSAAVEATGADNGAVDWGTSLAYEGDVAQGAKLKAVVGTESSSAIMANAKLSVADVTLGAMYGKDDDADKYLGGAIAYDLGALTLSAGMMKKDAENGTANQTAKQQDLQLGVEYALAPGLTLDGGLMQNKRTTFGDPALKANRYSGRIKLKF